jgi:hypothetical protein
VKPIAFSAAPSAAATFPAPAAPRVAPPAAPPAALLRAVGAEFGAEFATAPDTLLVALPSLIAALEPSAVTWLATYAQKLQRFS